VAALLSLLLSLSDKRDKTNNFHYEFGQANESLHTDILEISFGSLEIQATL
jgi:hypothetical protein